MLLLTYGKSNKYIIVYVRLSCRQSAVYVRNLFKLSTQLYAFLMLLILRYYFNDISCRRLQDTFSCFKTHFKAQANLIFTSFNQTWDAKLSFVTRRVYSQWYDKGQLIIYLVMQSPKLWTLNNFSRYIRQNPKRPLWNSINEIYHFISWHPLRNRAFCVCNNITTILIRYSGRGLTAKLVNICPEAMPMVTFGKSNTFVTGYIWLTWQATRHKDGLNVYIMLR